MTKRSVYFVTLILITSNNADSFTQIIRKPLEKLYKSANPWLKEPSPEIKTIAHEALSGTGFEKSVAIYEETLEDSSAYLFTQPFLMLSSLKDSSAKEYHKKIFAAHHEVGHIVSLHAHKTLLNMITPPLIAGSIILMLRSKLPRWATIGLFIASAPASMIFTNSKNRQYEKDADLYACQRLFEKKKFDPIVQEVRNFFLACLVDTSGMFQDPTHPHPCQRAQLIAQFMHQKGFDVVDLLFKLIRRQQSTLGYLIFDDEHEQETKKVLAQALDLE